MNKENEIGKVLEGVSEKTMAFNAAVGGGGALIYGYTLNEWVAIVTIVYMVLSTILLLPKYYAWISAALNKGPKEAHGE